MRSNLINEISKKTLASYTQKAVIDKGKHDREATLSRVGGDDDRANVANRKSGKRFKGILSATNRLAKESEDLQESPILGKGMSPETRARDIEQSDREYIKQSQQKEKWKRDNPGKKFPGWHAIKEIHEEHLEESEFIANLRRMKHAGEGRQIQFENGHSTTLPMSAVTKALNHYDSLSPQEKEQHSQALQSSLESFKKTIGETEQMNESQDEHITYPNDEHHANAIGWKSFPQYTRGEKSAKYVKHNHRQGTFHYTNDPGNLHKIVGNKLVKESEEMNESGYYMSKPSSEIKVGHRVTLENPHNDGMKGTKYHKKTGVVHKIHDGSHAEVKLDDGSTTHPIHKNFMTRLHESETVNERKYFDSDEIESMKAKKQKGKQFAQNRRSRDKEKRGFDESEEIAEIMARVNAGEELDEISKATLGSYVKKAANSGLMHAYAAGNSNHAAVSAPVFAPHRAVEREASNKEYSKAVKRQKGIEKAVHRLTKEELSDDDIAILEDLTYADVERLDEVSADTLRSYMTRVRSPENPKGEHSSDSKIATKRKKGFYTAAGKYYGGAGYGSLGVKVHAPRNESIRENEDLQEKKYFDADEIADMRKNKKAQKNQAKNASARRSEKYKFEDTATISETHKVAVPKKLHEAIMGILSQNRDVRSEAEIQEFKKRNQ